MKSGKQIYPVKWNHILNLQQIKSFKSFKGVCKTTQFLSDESRNLSREEKRTRLKPHLLVLLRKALDQLDRTKIKGLEKLETRLFFFDFNENQTSKIQKVSTPLLQKFENYTVKQWLELKEEQRLASTSSRFL